MVRLLQAGIGIGVFVLIISVWNWISSSLPTSPSGHLEWIIFLMALIAGLAVYYNTTKNR